MTDVYEIAQKLLDTRKELEEAEEAQVQIPLLEARVEAIPALEAKLNELRAALFAGPLESDTEVRDDGDSAYWMSSDRDLWRSSPAGPVGVAIQNDAIAPTGSKEEVDAAFEEAFNTDTSEQPITTVIDATEDEVEDDPYYATGAFAQ